MEKQLKKILITGLMLFTILPAFGHPVAHQVYQCISLAAGFRYV